MSDVIITARGKVDRRDRNRRSETGSREHSGLSPFVPLFLFSLIIPLLFYIGSLRFSPYRLLLVVLFLPLVVGWLSGKAGRIRLADISVVMLCIWHGLSMFVLHGPGVVIENTGIFFIETLGSYLLARRAIRTAEDFHGMVKWLYRVILCLLPFAVYETLTGHNIILDVFGRIGASYADIYKEPRWGLDRVQGPFNHPILFGVFCGGALALTYYVLGYGKVFFGRVGRLSLVFFTALLTLSSGPVTSFAAQLGLIGWDILLRRVRVRWWILLILVSLAWIVIEIGSNRSVLAVFISTFAFDPWTASYRLIIWDYGSASVLNRPIFGLGLSNNWERPYWLGGSVDMYWLLWAMRIGIPGAFFLLLALGATTLGVIRKRITDPRIGAYRKGFLIVMAGFFLAGWTVHYWNATHVLFFFLLGSGSWMLDAPAGVAPTDGDSAPRKTVAVRHQVPQTRALPERERIGATQPQRRSTSRGRAGSSRMDSD